MKVVIRLTEHEEVKAECPILLRHSPGMMLRDSGYIINAQAERALRDAGVKFEVISSEADPPGHEPPCKGNSPVCKEIRPPEGFPLQSPRPASARVPSGTG